MILNDGKYYDENSKILFSSIDLFEEFSIMHETKKEKNYNIYELILLPTERCNFRCAYCYENHDGPKWSDTDILSIKKLISRLLEVYDGVYIIWFGGEPMLELDKVIDVNSYARVESIKNNKYFNSSMTTNGVLLDKYNVEKCIKAGISGFQITLDGLSNTHNKTRKKADGSGTFDKIMKNLLDMKMLNYPFFNIVIRVNMTLEMLNDFEKIDGFFFETFHDDDRFSFLYKEVGDYGGEKVKDLAENMINKDDMRLVTKNNVIEVYNQLINIDCYATLENSMVVRGDLSIAQCTVKLYDPFNNTGRLYIDSTLEDINRISTSFKKTLETRKCVECIHHNRCMMPSCPYRTIDEDMCKRGQKEFESALNHINNNPTLQLLKKRGFYIDCIDEI